MDADRTPSAATPSRAHSWSAESDDTRTTWTGCCSCGWQGEPRHTLRDGEAHTTTALGWTGSAASTDLAVIEKGVPYPDELKACQDALGDIEVHIYEAWEFEKITKDAARHFLVIADICGWDMPWVAEMREWAE